MWNLIIPAAAAIGSALIGKKGQDDANQANLDISREQMAFNAEQAQLNRAFQSDMASSSYQRAVGDLRAAGLNPMLAYSQGGAPAPSGNMASAPTLPRQENSMAAGIQAAATAFQLRNMAAQNDNLEADTALKQSQADVNSAAIGKTKAETERIVTGEIPKMREDIKTVQNQNISWQTQNALNEADILLKKVQTLVATEEIDRVRADAALKRVQELLKKLEVPEAEAMAEKWRSSFGEMNAYTKEILEILKVLIFSRRGSAIIN